MLKRLFSRKKKRSVPPPPPEPLPIADESVWDAPDTPYLDYFNLHLHGLDLTQVVSEIRAKYLFAGPREPAIVVAQAGGWCGDRSFEM